ncbi:MAG: hypothetical protein ACXADA_12235 [Candidatus Hodarchaeales archaeon]
MSRIYLLSSMITCLIIVLQCFFGNVIPVVAVHIRYDSMEINNDSISDLLVITATNVMSSDIFEEIKRKNNIMSGSSGLIPSITTTNKNISVEFGIQEINISWVISDQSPNNYSILEDGEIIVNNQPWIENMTVNLTITDLQVGTREFMIIAENALGNKANNTIIVNVQDTTAPIVTILSPINGHEYSTTNLTMTINYTYHIEELSGCTVNVTLNYFNMLDDGLLEYLPAGSYIFKITVTDSSGNVGNDAVVFFITVVNQPTTANTNTTGQTSEQTTTTDTKDESPLSLPELVLFSSIGIVFVVSGFVLIRRRNLNKIIISKSKLVDKNKLPPLDPLDLESTDD